MHLFEQKPPHRSDQLRELGVLLEDAPGVVIASGAIVFSTRPAPGCATLQGEVEDFPS
jgi:hypothetical protein